MAYEQKKAAPQDEDIEYIPSEDEDEDEDEVEVVLTHADHKENGNASYKSKGKSNFTCLDGHESLHSSKSSQA